MRVGAIDCGTNSIRLLIADVDDGGLTDVVRMMRVVRLGQGVDATGRLAEESLQRTFTAAEEYGALLETHGAQRLRFVATSATRDAENRQDFVDGIHRRLGVEPEVITGNEEAALSFAGAASVLEANRPEPVLVIDLGGGSTEFVLGAGSGVTASASVNVGCVRLTERHLHTDPPTDAEIKAAVADVDAVIEEVLRDVPLDTVATVVGVAGSVTTVTAHALGLDSYDRDAIHAAELAIDDVAAAAADLLRMPREGRAELPYMHPGRVDVIGSGALIWERILRRLAELTGGRVSTAIASEHDILDGIALSAARSLPNGVS
ncbi:Ppx/GppA phosphatase family protein [Arthrobacter pigmenti]